MKTSNIRTHSRPTWAEVDLSAIRHNLLQIKRLINPDTKVLVAVKANAYGHGIIEVSGVLVDCGADYLGVATIDEGALLRKKGFKIPILMLGSILKDEIETAVKNNITQTVADIQLAEAINRYASKVKKKARVHIKIDVGMGRIGIWHEEALGLVARLIKLRHLEAEGIFSHFPSADEDEILTRQQIENFYRLIDELEDINIHFKYKHMANSIAVLDYKDSHMNLVRPGLMVYGLYPRKDFNSKKIKLKPALSLYSRIVFIKDVPPGRKISYGGTHTTVSHTKIATIPIGYGDGLSRRISNKGSVLVRGQIAPIVGRICMDQTMVDVGDIAGVKTGDKVTIIGSQNRQRQTAEEIAALCDTIPYEVACWFDNRIPRIYL
jgi:alanine racemase